MLDTIYLTCATLWVLFLAYVDSFSEVVAADLDSRLCASDFVATYRILALVVVTAITS